MCLGRTNWQLYGSRKPSNEAYELTYHYDCDFNKDINDWSLGDMDVNKFDFKKKLIELSVQYNYDMCLMKTSVKDEVNSASKPKKSRVLKIQNNNCTINYAEINSDEKLDLALEKLHTECENNPKDYKLKELHDLSLIHI